MATRAKLILVSFAVTACASLQETSALLPFETIDAQVQSKEEAPQNVVAKTREDWLTILETIKRPEAVGRIPIDFGEHMVIGVFIGGRPNSCYGVRITGIERDKGKVTVQYREIEPFGNRICLATWSTPGHLVKVKKFTEPVEFIKVGTSSM